MCSMSDQGKIMSTSLFWTVSMLLKFGPCALGGLEFCLFNIMIL